MDLNSPNLKLYRTPNNNHPFLILFDPDTNLHIWVGGGARNLSYDGCAHKTTNDIHHLFQELWVECPFVYTTKEGFILHMAMITGLDLSHLHYWNGLFKDE